MVTRNTAPLSFTCAALLILSFSGCASERGPRHGGFPGEGETRAPAIPEMEARGDFFAGTLGIEAVLNREGFRDLPPAGEAGPGRSSGAHGRTTFGGGFGGRRGETGSRGGESGGWRGGTEAADGPATHIVASSLPPVQLHLRATNHTSSAIDIEIPDFNSDFGNFVVQPRNLPIPADGSAEFTPMVSQLGTGAVEVPLTVAVRLNGKTETQVLTLRIK